MITLTRPQHAVLQKLASHLKISQKRLRDCLNENLAEQGVLAFNDIEEVSYIPSFNCLAGKFNLSQVLDKVKFFKSQLYADYLNFVSSEPRGSAMAYCVGGGVLVVASIKRISNVDHYSGIILSHDGLNEQIIILPIKSFLELEGPLP